LSYRITAFDGLAISEYLRRGDSQDMGTGAALTSFLSLPGGGFYDNYRDRKSPQGIRPITKSGLFWGTDAELRIELDAWRAKLGKRGRLTVEFDDSSLRWQWARLQDVTAPRSSDNKGGWLPFSLTWITAAQHWRGVVRREDSWTWGDGSWWFGDGSTEFGVGAESYDVTPSGTVITVNHGGTIDAPNVTLRFAVTGPWTTLTIINHATGQLITIEAIPSSDNSFVELNAGARAVYVGASARPILSVYRDYNTLHVLASHGLLNTQAVRLIDTGIYDGDYQPVTYVDDNHFTVPLPVSFRGYGTVTGGTMQQLRTRYLGSTFSDESTWLQLAPGENPLEIVWGTTPWSAAMTVEFDDHYA
jgi:hypothetical protein